MRRFIHTVHIVVNVPLGTAQNDAGCYSAVSRALTKALEAEALKPLNPGWTWASIHDSADVDCSTLEVPRGAEGRTIAEQYRAALVAAKIKA